VTDPLCDVVFVCGGVLERGPEVHASSYHAETFWEFEWSSHGSSAGVPGEMVSVVISMMSQTYDLLVVDLMPIGRNTNICAIIRLDVE